MGIFPNDAAALRLVTAVVATHDEWAVAERRYLSEESMAKLTHPDHEEVTLAITARHNQRPATTTWSDSPRATPLI